MADQNGSVQREAFAGVRFSLGLVGGLALGVLGATAYFSRAAEVQRAAEDEVQRALRDEIQQAAARAQKAALDIRAAQDVRNAVPDEEIGKLDGNVRTVLDGNLGAVPFSDYVEVTIYNGSNYTLHSMTIGIEVKVQPTRRKRSDLPPGSIEITPGAPAPAAAPAVTLSYASKDYDVPLNGLKPRTTQSFRVKLASPVPHRSGIQWHIVRAEGSVSGARIDQSGQH